jgi:HEPN domain-containing protein
VRQEAADSLAQAAEDLKTAKTLRRTDRHYATVFFSQQAAEKALKALHIERRRAGARTHNLTRLARILKAPEAVVKSARQLTPDYLTTRYPDAANGIPAEIYDEEIAGHRLAYAEEICRWVTRQLSTRR